MEFISAFFFYSLTLASFAVLSPDSVAFGEDFSGKAVAQASRLCVLAKLSPVTETHGRDARATLLAKFLWLRLCRAIPWQFVFLFFAFRDCPQRFS
jgi:hypothetical protein